MRVKRPWNEIRLQILREMREILTKEEIIDQIAQEKIRNQKRDIPRAARSGSCSSGATTKEMKRYGIDLTPASATPFSLHFSPPTVEARDKRPCLVSRVS